MGSLCVRQKYELKSLTIQVVDDDHTRRKPPSRVRRRRQRRTRRALSVYIGQHGESQHPNRAHVLTGIVPVHPEHTRTSTNGGCGQVEHDDSTGRRLGLPPSFEDTAASMAPNDSQHSEEGMKMSKASPSCVVVKTRRRVDCLQPPRR